MTYFSNFCVLVQAVRQVKTPPGLDPSSVPGGDAFNAAKEQVKERAKDIASKVPKPRSGRR